MNFTTYLRKYAFPAVVLVGSTFLGACSGNIEEGLYADSESHISLAVSANGFENGMLSIGSAQSMTVFNVESTTRWTVDVTDCEGAWCQIVYGSSTADESGHIGNGTFTVEVAPNRSSLARECEITVYAVEGDGTHIPGKSILIHLTQDRQSISVDYAGDVISPFGTTENTEPTVTVTANQAWLAGVSHNWLTIIPGDGMSGGGFSPATGSTDAKTIGFRFKVDANPGTNSRTAEVTISSPTSAFTPIRLNVTQEGSTAAFFITPSNVPEVSSEGGELEFLVYSPREDWTVKSIALGDWIVLDKTSGSASPDPVTIKATILENPTEFAREAALAFIRGGDMGETLIVITQQPGSGVTTDPDIPNSGDNRPPTVN